MRVLHLTAELPYWPGGTGGATRQFQLLRRLVERGHEVTVVAPLRPDHERGVGALRDAGIGLRAIRRPESRVAEVVRGAIERPALVAEAITRPVLAAQVGVFWRRLRPLALRAVDDLDPDVVHVEHDHSAAWIADLPPRPSALSLQNVSWHYYRSRADAARGPERLLLRLEAERFRRYDARHLDRYDALIAVSERDRADLRAAYAGPVELVPNGADVDELAPTPEPDGPPALLFTGSMDHPPNSDGAVWLVEEIWPHIRARVPDARLRIVGRSPPPQVERLGTRPGVEVTGPVPAVGPYFGAATAVVIPLRSGGGTRLKAVEAMAAGRAVVSTTVGVEGIDVEDGRHLLVRDDPEEFAQAAVELLRQPGLRRDLAGHARALATERYAWRALGDRLEAALLRVVERAARGQRQLGR